MPSWPEKRQIIGTSVRRLDGPLKVSGKAKYSHDRNLPGLLHAKFLRSPHARAKIASLDIDSVASMPGVKATHVVKGAGSDLFYAGDEIAAVAAETEDLARDAVRAIKIEYEVLPHVSNEEDALKMGGDAVKAPNVQQGGDVEQALKDAQKTVEGFYGAPVVTHVCLETHGLVAHWVSEAELVVYASTQAVGATAQGLQQHFKQVPDLKVTCETPFMGGGFGSKFGPDVQGIVAAELALKAKRPVKLMLERDEEHVAGGNRPSAYARVKAGVDENGILTAFSAESWGTGGNSRGAGFPLPYVYAPPNFLRQHTDVVVHAGDARAMRAPGHPQGCLIMEQVMDDLADAIGMDPIALRLKNLPTTNRTFRTLEVIYTRELMLGAERTGWFERRHPRGDRTPGHLKRGMGCALGTWGGGAGGSQATCVIHADGRVVVSCGTQDLGTGTMTLVPMVAAEILGLEVRDITGQIGSSAYPPSGGSGGSTTVGGVSLSVAMASTKALAKLFERVAALLEAEATGLEAEGGRIYVKANPSKGLSWKQACAYLGQEVISESASKDEGRGMSDQGVGGAQFAEVVVDVETGEVSLEKLVAVADCGLVMNRLLCESQVYGGVIGGINYALYEDRRLDRATCLQVNPDMEWYKLAKPSDLRNIEVHLLDYPERGVIGIGEPPTIPTAAAIANAVCNAIGVRVPTIPFTPKHVLDALAASRSDAANNDAANNDK
ncbi:MAG TPA: xanthine dehydrogenase family protein molybdopterin-binding subunit [Planctomycetota bacterium]|nr:xanthine dehydrogenase family protein molybdopterin-binding subunit [Planctomycetota bacterium]